MSDGPHQDLRTLARSGMTFNAPMSLARADALVAALSSRAPRDRGLDLGCGWGELMQRIAIAGPQIRWLGIDVDRPSLVRGRRLAFERGLAGRVHFVQADATRFGGRSELVLCVGASHAWGPSAAALRALADRVLPGGVVLFGDGFWQSAPGPAATAIFGELPDLEGLTAAARGAGFRVAQRELAGLDEWDEFESSARTGLARSELAAARAEHDRRLREYQETYRGVLGFAYLLLER